MKPVGVLRLVQFNALSEIGVMVRLGWVLDNLNEVDMLEGLLEGAHRYAVAANALMCYSDLGAEAEVNAALGMELLLKSLLPRSEVALEQGLDKYSFNTGAPEDLVLLYGRIARNIREKLNLKDELYIIARKREIISRGRGEGRGAYQVNDNDLVYCLGRVIPRVVDYFKGMGSKNAWICSYPDIPEAVKLRTGLDQGGTKNCEDDV
jgi:hypothetical protein